MQYALVKDGVVENVVEWDGEGNLFEGYVTVNIESVDCGIGWSYKSGVFSPPPLPEISIEELYLLADRKKSELIAEAISTTAMWRTELQLGILSDVDKESLTAWINYYKAVQAVDTSKAPDIEWPDKPQPQ